MNGDVVEMFPAILVSITLSQHYLGTQFEFIAAFIDAL